VHSVCLDDIEDGRNRVDLQEIVLGRIRDTLVQKLVGDLVAIFGAISDPIRLWFGLRNHRRAGGGPLGGHSGETSTGHDV
jgi:hypothetical protein